MKRCWKCKEEKSVDDFNKDRSRPDGLSAICSRCRSDALQAKVKINPSHYNDRYKRDKARIPDFTKRGYLKYKDKIKQYYSTPKGRFKRLLSSASRRSKKIGVDFDLDLNWLTLQFEKQNGKCLLTGIELDFALDGTRHTSPFAPSLDKINTKGGYTKDNVRLVCNAVNMAMNEFGEEVFARVASSFLKNRNPG